MLKQKPVYNVICASRRSIYAANRKYV